MYQGTNWHELADQSMCGLKFGQKPVAQVTCSCHSLCMSCRNAHVFADDVHRVATFNGRQATKLVHLTCAVELTVLPTTQQL